MDSRSSESIDSYVAQIHRYPLLSREEEQELATRYIATGEMEAAHKLVVSNLRFVVKIAHEYRGYNFKLLDLVQEGNIGLMMAVKKFDPERGYRLISYAVWWIRAYIQNFVIRSWSLVKLGTTQAQRKLFFKLRSEREKADRAAGPGARADFGELADRLGVEESDIMDMEMRLAARDYSLDNKVDADGRQTHIELLESEDESQESLIGQEDEERILRKTVAGAMDVLNEKEQYIIRHRLLSDEPQTLQSIGEHFGISRERARQIEGNVLRKLKTILAESGMDARAA